MAPSIPPSNLWPLSDERADLAIGASLPGAMRLPLL